MYNLVRSTNLNADDACHACAPRITERMFVVVRFPCPLSLSTLSSLSSRFLCSLPLLSAHSPLRSIICRLHIVENEAISQFQPSVVCCFLPQCCRCNEARVLRFRFELLKDFLVWRFSICKKAEACHQSSGNLFPDVLYWHHLGSHAHHHKPRKAKADKAEAEMLLGSRRRGKSAAEVTRAQWRIRAQGLEGRIPKPLEFASGLGLDIFSQMRKGTKPESFP